LNDNFVDHFEGELVIKNQIC